jgi:putative endonuclease
MTAAARRRAYARGRRAEALAAWWLRLKGFRILARGWRSPVGEIDIVARRGRILAVVEVKRRDSLAGAGEAISHRQQRRLQRAAALFVQRHPELADLELRFDAMLMVPHQLPRHLPDAWRPEF